MAVLSTAQARSYAQAAGFSGNGLNIIVAIAQAESSLNTQATHTNGDGSIDRGIVQINSRWHPEVSASCAFDPACAMQQAYRISNRGTNFTPWSTYNNGAYLRYLGGAAAGGAVTRPPAEPQQKRWFDFPVLAFNDYVTVYKGGDTPHWAGDFQTPMDTPFFFLEPGTITTADYKPWGGEVFEQPDGGRPYQEYAYHLDRIDVQVGQHVQAGQIVGLTGGQTSGGQHPTQPQFSSGPHLHFGLFTKYVSTPIGTEPYGPDYRPLVAAAKAGDLSSLEPGGGGNNNSTVTGSATTPKPLGELVNQVLSEFPGFRGIAYALDDVMAFPGVIWYDPGTTVQVLPGDNAFSKTINGTASFVLSPDDYIGAGIRSVLDTIFSNAVPFFLRALVVLIGLLLVAGLAWNAVNSSGLAEKIAEVAVAA